MFEEFIEHFVVRRQREPGSAGEFSTHQYTAPLLTSFAHVACTVGMA